MGLFLGLPFYSVDKPVYFYANTMQFLLLLLDARIGNTSSIFLLYRIVFNILGKKHLILAKRQRSDDHLPFLMWGGNRTSGMLGQH